MYVPHPRAMVPTFIWLYFRSVGRSLGVQFTPLFFEMRFLEAGYNIKQYSGLKRRVHKQNFDSEAGFSRK